VSTAFFGSSQSGPRRFSNKRDNRAMATNVFERHLTDCPYARARAYLRESVEDTARKGRVTILPLTAALPFVPGALEKNVLVSYRPGQDPMRFDEPWQVHWTPEGGGPYPDFDGEITVRADESYRRAVLELRGEYKPPLGTFGQAFDLIIGSKIAARTARALLQEIARGMEERFNDEEDLKEHVG
jgi:hypothetical protein